MKPRHAASAIVAGLLAFTLPGQARAAASPPPPVPAVATGASPHEPLATTPPAATLPATTPIAAPAPALLAAIDAALAGGRLDTARALMARALMARADATSDHPDLRLRAAEVWLADNSLAAAATAFADLATDPVLAPVALQGLGLARLRQNNLPAAILALDAGLARDPTLARAWTARGVAADRARDFTTADAAYARALALTPRDAAVVANRGYSLMLRGRHTEAEADLVAALALEPGLAIAATNLRLARALQGRYAEAFAGATPGGLAADLNTVGFAAMARGDIRIAETYFTRAVALNPRFDRVATANLAYLQGRSQ